MSDKDEKGLGASINKPTKSHVETLPDKVVIAGIRSGHGSCCNADEFLKEQSLTLDLRSSFQELCEDTILPDPNSESE